MIVVCIPTTETIYTSTAFNVATLKDPGVPMKLNNVQSVYIDRNQNQLVELALKEEEVTHLLFIEHDMLMPLETAKVLLAHDKDIVGATYRKRKPPYSLIGLHEDGRPVDGTETGLHPMMFMPTGLLLVRADVFRRLDYPWFYCSHGRCVDEFRGNDEMFCEEVRFAGLRLFCDFNISHFVVHQGQIPVDWNLKCQST